MRKTLPSAANVATDNARQVSTSNVKTVGKVVQLASARIRFRDLAKFAWPSKTEHHLAHITGYAVRTCERWLADNTEPPAEALGAVLCEIMRRFHQRE